MKKPISRAEQRRVEAEYWTELAMKELEAITKCERPLLKASACADALRIMRAAKTVAKVWKKTYNAEVSLGLHNALNRLAKLMGVVA
jgi:hypothetical protein